MAQGNLGKINTQAQVQPARQQPTAPLQFTQLDTSVVNNILSNAGQVLTAAMQTEARGFQQLGAGIGSIGDSFLKGKELSAQAQAACAKARAEQEKEAKAAQDQKTFQSLFGKKGATPQTSTTSEPTKITAGLEANDGAGIQQTPAQSEGSNPELLAQKEIQPIPNPGSQFDFSDLPESSVDSSLQARAWVASSSLSKDEKAFYENQVKQEEEKQKTYVITKLNQLYSAEFSSLSNFQSSLDKDGSVAVDNKLALYDQIQNTLPQFSGVMSEKTGYDSQFILQTARDYLGTTYGKTRTEVEANLNAAKDKTLSQASTELGNMKSVQDLNYKQQVQPIQYRQEVVGLAAAEQNVYNNSFTTWAAKEEYKRRLKAQGQQGKMSVGQIKEQVLQDFADPGARSAATPILKQLNPSYNLEGGQRAADVAITTNLRNTLDPILQGKSPLDGGKMKNMVNKDGTFTPEGQQLSKTTSRVNNVFQNTFFNEFYANGGNTAKALDAATKAVEYLPEIKGARQPVGSGKGSVGSQYYMSLPGLLNSSMNSYLRSTDGQKFLMDSALLKRFLQKQRGNNTYLGETGDSGSED